jgi:hypothetical protein
MGDPLTRRFAPQNLTHRGRRQAAMWPPSSNSTDRATPEGAALAPEAPFRSCTGRAVESQLPLYSGITAADRGSLVATAAATAAVLVATGLTRPRVR